MFNTLGNLNAKDSNLRSINYRGMELIVAIRPGTQQLFHKLAQRFTLHVVTHIGSMDKDLIYQLLALIDQTGTIFPEREKQIKTYGIDQYKTSSEILAKATNAHDFLIIDRIEWRWESRDQNHLVLLKTWAPLSGKLKVDMVDANPFVFSLRTPGVHELIGESVEVLGTLKLANHLILADSKDFAPKPVKGEIDLLPGLRTKLEKAFDEAHQADLTTLHFQG